MNSPLWDPLTIEVRHFFKQQVILKDNGTPRTYTKGTLAISYRASRRRGQFSIVHVSGSDHWICGIDQAQLKFRLFLEFG